MLADRQQQCREKRTLCYFYSKFPGPEKYVAQVRAVKPVAMQSYGDEVQRLIDETINNHTDAFKLLHYLHCKESMVWVEEAGGTRKTEKIRNLASLPSRHTSGGGLRHWLSSETYCNHTTS